jgi:hypothetical protein
MSSGLDPTRDTRADEASHPGRGSARRSRSSSAAATVFSAALFALLACVPLVRNAPHTATYPRALLTDMIAGTAHRPYVKRALIPLVVRGLDALLPESIRRMVAAETVAHPDRARRLGWSEDHTTWRVLVFVLHGVALVLFAVFFRRLLRATFAIGEPAALIAAAIALLLVPIHFGYANFLYDYPALALFTIGLALLAERRRTLFYGLWPIGLLNKETFVLLAIVFWITQTDLPPARRVRPVIALIAFAAALWVLLGWVYRRDPGAPLEWHLARNLAYVPSPRLIVHFAVYVGLWIYAFLWWREKRALALETLVVGGALIGATLFLGFVDEFRDYYEAYPLLALMAAHTTLRLLHRAPALVSA